MSNDRAPTVGLDLGGTKLLAVAIDAGGSVVACRKLPAPPAGPRFPATVAGVAEEVAGGRPGALGLGIPGMVDAGGRLRFSPHQPGLVGVPLAAELSAALGGNRVWVGNDATCAGWAEYTAGAGAGAGGTAGAGWAGSGDGGAGGAAGARGAGGAGGAGGARGAGGAGGGDLLMVTLGTGIGGGIVSGGRLLQGAHCYAGEIGHMVVDRDGQLCSCGQRGCWEQMASGRALGRLAQERAQGGQAPGIVAAAGGDPDAVTGESVTAAASVGDPDAVGVMGEYAGWLALGLANLTNVLDPGLVVIGGGLAEAGEVLMAPLRAAFADLVEGYEHRAGLSIVPAALGERAGAVGAALLAGKS